MAFTRCPWCNRPKPVNLWGLTWHIEIIHSRDIASQMPVVEGIVKRLVEKKMSLQTATAVLSVAFRLPDKLPDVQTQIDERADWKRSDKIPSNFL